MICDFCSAPIGADHKAYKADDFVHREIKGVQLASAGDWCACRTCASMVDDEDWANLLVRSANTVFENNPHLKSKVPYSAVCDQISELHGQFRKARCLS